MKVSKKSDYALRVLFSLVDHYGSGPVSIRELAEKNEVPKSFLEHILLDLKAMGWVDSTPGKYGGYFLTVSPEEIKMGQVVRLFDSILAPINCVSVRQYEACSQEPTCRFRRLFLQIRNQTALMMDNATLASVHAGQPVQAREVFGGEFSEGDGI